MSCIYIMRISHYLVAKGAHSKVGYGPNFNSGATVADNIHGLAYEVWGKLTHNPDKIREGHEIFSGERKRKKLDESDPVFDQGSDATKNAQKAPTDNKTAL
ncbi:hypothetical protein D9619_010408 [Psilocybe cf. subviscida]|uniref:Uncharacterized protein n=1 Tax=Psilocybe cf. subviscida TaxID=2480587 RepID=A0A8H5ERR5_9AGAR|nr:hypothetical protein D9619_010408 [Psilocybe cf. subviscida]